MPLLKKMLLPLGSLFLLGIVIFNVPPPKSLSEATPFQIISFFGPLFLFIYSTVQLVIKFWLRSVMIASGVIVLIVLYLLDFLNLATLAIIVGAVVLVWRYLKKPDPYQIPRKIPKLSRLEKQR